ncbi:radical SAM protein [Pseudonocardia tropica]|uniref:Radical SAM protein n=1 Tax=Pseudonocardia tropica TaxID=681289 RepID=A0ABV1K254_9PSEU
MRVLLVWPCSRNEVLGWGDLGAVAEPLALEYLAAGLGLDGHAVQVLDLRLHPGSLDRTLDEFAPHVVGVTAYSMHVLAALKVCAQVKARRPNCRTVVGGHHATLLPEDFLEPQCDHVVVGEGVAPARALLAALSAGNPERAVAGVWSRGQTGFVWGGEPGPFRIDDLPQPDRSVTAGDRHAYFIDWMKPVALVRTTVGCPYRCTFCSLWKIMDGRYHRREIDGVVAEIAGIDEEFVFLVDDEAFIDGRRMTALARALHAAGVRKRLFAYCRIDTLLRQRDAVAAWKEVGLERLFVGIDATTGDMLQEYNKRVTVSQVEAGLRLARELGIEIFAQFVVSPTFSRRDFRQLVRFIEHHRISYPSFTVLTPIPGTAMLETFDAVTERQSNGRPNWELFDCQHAVTATALPREEFIREYVNLFQVFNGAYTRHRDHNVVVDNPTCEGDIGAMTALLRRRSAPATVLAPPEAAPHPAERQNS